MSRVHEYTYGLHTTLALLRTCGSHDAEILTLPLSPDADSECFVCKREFGARYDPNDKTEAPCMPLQLQPCRHLIGIRRRGEVPKWMSEPVTVTICQAMIQGGLAVVNRRFFYRFPWVRERQNDFILLTHRLLGTLALGKQRPAQLAILTHRILGIRAMEGTAEPRHYRARYKAQDTITYHDTLTEMEALRLWAYNQGLAGLSYLDFLAKFFLWTILCAGLGYVYQKKYFEVSILRFAFKQIPEPGLIACAIGVIIFIAYSDWKDHMDQDPEAWEGILVHHGPIRIPFPVVGTRILCREGKEGMEIMERTWREEAKREEARRKKIEEKKKKKIERIKYERKVRMNGTRIFNPLNGGKFFSLASDTLL
ncbi:hypothetical protein K491DRAFT_728553 [Lophiostoma macrostomum CBS 122681]|uniref:Uncharacterized protein n=1 Tax=Lophiostoma macrostomum CBS 122681 TaxID=1314788 RepID=A0A6A6TN99_9PLEO|nr:hypothetical protein K491DRAFT_728553 [Lophiostoma macrostomum CBS 122681]